MVAEAAPVALMVVEHCRRIACANPSADRLFGRPPGGLVGCRIDAVLPDGLDRAVLARDDEPLLAARRPDGSTVPVEVRKDVVEIDGRRFQIVAVTDASHLVQLRTSFERRTRELRRSNDELREFAHVASHDLRQPLRTIGSFIDLLVSHLGDRIDPTADEYAQFVRSGVLRMQQLISDLLTYAQIGGRQPPMRPVDMTRVLDAVLCGLRVALDEAEADIRLSDMPEIVGDEIQLTQLLQNLIENAIKFRAEGRRPEVEISAERQSRGWLFRVIDNGIGIPAAQAERIFQMFKRLHGQERYPGSGIGLALARKIAERHGGRLWLESVEGEGTTFYFTVPDPDHRLVSEPLELVGRPGGGAA